MKKVELLAPAGSPECFEAALRFGADAVYMAGKSFGLRAFADNFTPEEMALAIRKAHDLGKKVYITVNALLRGPELEEAEAYLGELARMQADAAIISDPGVLTLCKKVGLPAHLSTQVSTMNRLSAGFWYDQGVERIVLARESSLEDIRDIAENGPQGLSLEVFVHGAMCVAYSGRCLLSSVFTGRSGNKGACAQPCRWEYAIKEKGYPDDEFTVMEDGRGTYILNSKDLNMLPWLPQLLATGVDSLKIEGRMKSAYYVGSVVNAYRKALDLYYKDPESYSLPEELMEELRLSSTRRFTSGFYFGQPGGDSQDIHKALEPRSFVFCAKVQAGERVDGLLPVEQRNKFSVGEEVFVLSPHMEAKSFKVERIFDGEQDVDSAPHPQQQLWINCPYPLEEGDMLRKKKE